MANKLPPLPMGILPGHAYWNDWAEKLRSIINEFANGFPWSQVSGTPTTAAGYGITDVAVLNGSSRTTNGVDTTDDVIVDDSANGLVLKSPNGTYYRATINNSGVVTWTSLGTTKP